MPIIAKEKKENKTEKVSKIRVANTEIVIGNQYQIIPKKDLDAPHPLNGAPTTKNQMPGIGEVRSVVWDETMRRWDTGFEERSACNSNISPADKQSLVEIYNKYIKEPYEEYYNVDASATNDTFWSDYMYEINTNKSFDTSNPKDLFDLFHALKQGRICEVGERDATLQRSAKYCVRNLEKQVSYQEERAKNKAKAIRTFMNMLDSLDPKKDDTLYTILEWMNLSNIRGADAEVLERQVLKMFDNEKTGHDSAERFMEAHDKIKSDAGKEEMELFSIVNKLNVRRKLEFKRQQYYLEDVLIGNTTKAAAKAALTNPEIKELILSAWEKIQ